MQPFIKNHIYLILLGEPYSLLRIVVKKQAHFGFQLNVERLTATHQNRN